MKTETNSHTDATISEAEWSVMETLWAHPLSTLGEIKDALSSRGWSDSTIKTMVRRLVNKNVVAINDEMPNFRYYALLGENECRMKETRRFLGRIYNGSVRMMMTGLVAESDLSEKETEELLSLIEKMGEKKEGK